ncbi:MAG: hypothetical protein PHO46_09160 [Thermoguttaceae bacterium]|nr:hypothetical protein [Thermoguttaceae bacterium]
MSKSVSGHPVRSSESFEHNTLNPLLSLGILGLVLICLTIFFTSPLPNFSAPRWILLLEPTINANFVKEIWFGVDLPPASFSGERIVAFILGLFFVISSLFLGLFCTPLLKRTFKLNKLEIILFATGIGLILWSCIFLWLGLIGQIRIPTFQSSVGIILISGLYFVACRVFTKRKQALPKPPIAKRSSSEIGKDYLSTASNSRTDKLLLYCQFALLILFASFYVFSATQPIFEYDAVEYHVQSAREMFETGTIAFSPNNVYANMPLGVEMYYVAGFNIADNLGFSFDDTLRIGSLIGKTIITSFAYLTALALFAFGLRFLNSLRLGLWSAIAFLSLPGVFEVYVSGLNDCVLSFTLFMAFYLLLLKMQNYSNGANINCTTSLSNDILFFLLLGLFAGFALGIKYTGVVFVLIPAFLLGTLIHFFPRKFDVFFIKKSLVEVYNDSPSSESLYVQLEEKKIEDQQDSPLIENNRYIKATVLVVVFLLTALLVSGGWYIRNAVATGNPVFPLAYSVFGDKSGSWNESIDARWNKAHSSASFGANAIRTAIRSSLWQDDLASPFFLLLGTIGALALGISLKKLFQKKQIGSEGFFISILTLLILYWAGWFFMTHRLVRFLLPAAPLAAVLIGCLITRGLTLPSRLAKSAVFVSTLLCLLYSSLLIDLLGQGRMAPLQALERDPYRFTAASIYFNEHPELFVNASQTSNNSLPTKKLLLIGEAKAFMYRIPILYSTCWNDSPLIPLLDDCVERDSKGQIISVTDRTRLLKNIHQAGVEFILVDFSELARFRSRGNYGFNNPEIDERLFLSLLNAQIIVPYSVPELKNDQSNAVQIFKVYSSSNG